MIINWIWWKWCTNMLCLRLWWAFMRDYFVCWDIYTLLLCCFRCLRVKIPPHNRSTATKPFTTHHFLWPSHKFLPTSLPKPLLNRCPHSRPYHFPDRCTHYRHIPLPTSFALTICPHRRPLPFAPITAYIVYRDHLPTSSTITVCPHSCPNRLHVTICPHHRPYHLHVVSYCYSYCWWPVS